MIVSRAALWRIAAIGGQLRSIVRAFDMRPVSKPLVSELEVTYGEARYRIAVKRVNRARRFTLRVRAATQDAVLTMPKAGSIRAARSFAERHAEWVGTRLERLPQRVSFEAGSVIPIRGDSVPIVLRQSLRSAAWLDVRTLPDGHQDTVLCVTGTPEQQRRRVSDFLRRESRRDLDAAVRRHAATLGKTVGTITLRDTRTRWGSCTSRGALNFSWRLILAPPHVLDYLAAHEVAHLVHMNHSADYWAVAARLAPELDAAEAWLKQNGASLHRYG